MKRILPILESETLEYSLSTFTVALSEAVSPASTIGVYSEQSVDSKTFTPNSNWPEDITYCSNYNTVKKSTLNKKMASNCEESSTERSCSSPVLRVTFDTY